MRMIREHVDGENYLEFLLLTKEIQSLSSKKIVSMVGEIGHCIYQIGIRSASPAEINEINETREEEEVPLLRGNSQATISSNISEMEKAGHPHAQSVAAALNEAKGPKKKKKAKKKAGKK